MAVSSHLLATRGTTRLLFVVICGHGRCRGLVLSAVGIVKRTRTLVPSLCLNFVCFRLHIIIAALGRILTVYTSAEVVGCRSCGRHADKSGRRCLSTDASAWQDGRRGHLCATRCAKLQRKDTACCCCCCCLVSDEN